MFTECSLLQLNVDGNSTPKTDLVMTGLLLFGYQQCQTGILKHEFLTEIEAPRDTTVYCSITTLIPLSANTFIAANSFKNTFTVLDLIIVYRV